MKKGMDRQGFAYGVIAAVLFCALFLVTFPEITEERERRSVQIVAFGDSVFGETQDETAIPLQLQELLGMSVYNAALGGTCMARVDADRRLDYARDSLSLAGLAKAVWADDFGVQQAARVRENGTEYFPEVIDGLEIIDFTQVEMVIIQKGVNDYHAGIALDNPSNPYDEYTFLGALRSAVAALRKVNPGLRIVAVTPTYTWYIVKGLTCEEMDEGGGILEAYVEAELQMAEELGIEVIDMYHNLYPHEQWEDWELYTKDGVHPNEAGRQLLAEKIAEALKGS